ncbi:GumC family protein [Litoreibacter janthinus]|uniref:Uncharacterized protein involved in exopolysaccharide biosynthesis n=1 Tax=Litoreibacter janthinus TaxID=670154 RepID=A0A1I6FUZ5_9RHOB|nr:hypothetical protein [Litoreibacter janthinus]SFR33772.1 Uncharacterized protein involved in exopolysaccharide biosynthesis [Litoreibacter janthinus]
MSSGFLWFVFKRKYSIFGTFAVVVGLTITLLYLIAPVYGAKSSVLVERNRAPNMRTEFQPGLEMVEVINTEANLALSDEVITRAVEIVKPHVRTKPRSSMGEAVENFRKKLGSSGLMTYLPARERWIRRLQRTVEAKPVPNSNVLEIIYFDEDPKRASDIVNALVDSYLIVRDNVYRSSAAVSLYSTQLANVTSRIADRRAELDEIRTSMTAASGDTGIRSSELTAENLNQELLAIRRELDDLRDRFQPTHPRIVENQKRMVDLETQLQEALASSEMETALTARTDQLTMLIEADTSTFQRLKTRLDEAELSEIADRSLNNVRKIDDAAEPMKPRFERLLLILLSIPLGLFLGLSIGFIREYFDDSISGLPEAEQALGIPGYGTVDRYGVLFSAAR